MHRWLVLFHFPSLHVVVPLTLSLLCGIWWGDSHILLIPFLFITVLLVAFKLFSLQVATLLYCSALFCVGTTTVAWAHLSFTHKQQLLSSQPWIVTGTISAVEHSKNKRFKSVVTIETCAIAATKIALPIPFHATIQVYLAQPISFAVADNICLGNIRCTKTSPSFARYLIKEGISGCSFPPTIRLYHWSRPTRSWSAALSRIKHSLFEELQAKLSPATGTLFATIFLGNKQTNIREQKRQKLFFKWWGLSHYLARSGLHLMILALLLLWLLGLLPLPFYLKHLLVLFFISGYSLLSWASISFWRAFYLVCCYQLCHLASLRIHFFHLFSICTFIVLLTCPLQLFFLDFQLSFGVTGALAWLNYVQKQRKQAPQNNSLE